MIKLLLAVALTGATLHTGDGKPIENGTVIIDGDRIGAVGKNVQIPPGAEVIDVSGSIITPGLVDANSRLGTAEFVTGAPSTVEGTLDEKYGDLRAALRVSDTFNPRAFAIPIAREGGITSILAVPRGGIVQGQSAWIDLSDGGGIRRGRVAVHVSLGGENEAGSRSRKFMRLREVLEDARLFRANRGPYIQNRLRVLAPSAEALEVLARALDREIKVVFEVDRAPDIRAALAIIREQELDAVLVGVEEGWLAAKAIADAKVPVLVDPYANLPEDFDRLQARLDNAALLAKAGVKVAFTLRGESTRAGRLRFGAGIAVANGFDREAALAAITSVPSDIFGMKDEGRIRPGARANLAVWNGDPFEPMSWATRLFIGGKEIDLRTRQDLLTERYR